MRGFLVGTFALVVLSAFLQKDASDHLSQGTNVVAEAFRRLTAPDVAGVPLRAGVGGKKAPAKQGPAPAGQDPGPAGIQPGVPYRSGVIG